MIQQAFISNWDYTLNQLSSFNIHLMKERISGFHPVTTERGTVPAHVAMFQEVIEHSDTAEQCANDAVTL